MMKEKIVLVTLFQLLTCALPAQNLVKNGTFESSTLDPWKVTNGNAVLASDEVAEGKQCLRLESASGISQPLTLQPNSRYRLSAMLRCGTGAEDVQMRLLREKYVQQSVASPLVDWVEKSLEFQTGNDASAYSVAFVKAYSPTATGAWIDNVKVVRIGDATKEKRQGIPSLPQREPASDLGISQQPNEKIEWLLDAKLGLFIHWGLYSGLARGEWAMHNIPLSIDKYRELAYKESGEKQFTADSFNAAEWAALAKEAGMRYMCLTTQHHDGYALFHSKYPDIFSSYQTLNRDFVKEYTDACRESGLRVGLYKTLINWRYPGYYDATGENCLPNKWGYTTAAWHKDNATAMKNELYCTTKELMSNYGKIDLLFWDGGWLGERGTDADATYFWEPGQYLNDDNQWPVGDEYTLADSTTGKRLGLMGMVRALQPDLVCNIRCGWMGDYENEEGGGQVTGPLRTTAVVEKCMSLHSAWGYTPDAENAGKVMKLPALKRMFADCLIRNMVLSLNIGPDRHGHITDAEANLLRDFGKWNSSIAEAVYGTRGGPWNPEDNEFGFTYKDNTIYVFLLDGYKGGNTFLFPAIETHKVKRVYNVATGQPLKWKKQKSGETLVSGINRTDGDITVFAVQLNKNVR